MQKTTKERVRQALEKMPDDLPLAEFLDSLHGLVQIEESREDIERGNVVPNEELWKARPWRK